MSEWSVLGLSNPVEAMILEERPSVVYGYSSCRSTLRGEDKALILSVQFSCFDTLTPFWFSISHPLVEKECGAQIRLKHRAGGK
jgi:hypothetical protein